MHKIIFMISLFLSTNTQASEAYLSGAATFNAAAIAVYGPGAGFGTTSCLLCHNNVSGGLGNIASGFGTDFTNRALALFSKGRDLTQSNLEDILNDSTFSSTDSDGDGSSNATEIAANSNPNENSASVSDSGGGCGVILPQTPKGPGPGLVLFLLPLLFILILRKKEKGQRTSFS